MDLNKKITTYISKVLCILRSIIYNVFKEKKEENIVKEKKYNVLDFSDTIIYIAHELNMPITNLQLEKCLYYIQGYYMKSFGYTAFDEQFECWEYGPVIRKVWKVFSYYSEWPLPNREEKIKLSKEEKDLIISVLKEKLSINVWKLVENTHNELPWKIAYENKNDFISNKDMETFFCHE